MSTNIQVHFYEMHRWIQTWKAEYDVNVIGMNLSYEETQQSAMNDVMNEMEAYVTGETHDTDLEDVEGILEKKVKGRNKPN